VRPDALLHFAVPRVEPTVADQNLAQQYAQVRESMNNPDVQRQVLASILGESAPLQNSAFDAYARRIRGWLDFLDRAGYDPDRLLITLDDNRPGPLSDGLKLLLGKYSRHVHDGTDEGMMLLFARALRERQTDLPTTCGIVWTDPGDLTAVMPFEGAMVAENLLSMADWLGLRVSPDIDLLESWRPVLWINGSGAPDDRRAESISTVCAELGDRRVIVADVAKTNMGDSVLIDTWRGGTTPRGLIGYVGWNTSSNALGNALALWAATDFAYFHSADPEGVRAATETFLWARLLDDYFYQAKVRGERRDLLVAEGGDPYHLTPEQTAEEEGAIADRLTELWREMGQDMALPLRYVAPLDHTGFIVELPWSRLFEIALYPTDYRGILPVIRPAQ
jgi:hypothetical protein